MKKYFKKLLLALSACVLGVASFSSMASDIPTRCEPVIYGNDHVLSHGYYTGTFITLMNRYEWAHPTYLFKGKNEYNEPVSGCVQYNENVGSRTNAINNAFLLNKTVTIRVDGNHEIYDIYYNN